MSGQTIVIVGSGLAGYTLAREIRKRDKGVNLIMVSRDHGGYYSKPMVSTALANNKQPEALILKSSRQMQDELGMLVVADTAIEALDPEGKSVLLQSGERLAYRDMVLAIGADPIRPGIDGNATEAILSVNDLDDYSQFRRRFGASRSVAILGAGLIGCEFANDLITHGKVVTLIDPQQWPLARLVPEEAGAFLRSRLEGVGVAFRLAATVASIDSRPGHEFELTLQDGRSLTADLILAAVGLRPRTKIAAQAGIAVERGIMVDRLLATSAPGVYALGDCAQVEGLCLPYVMPLMRQARALAATLCGVPTVVTYPAMPVTVKTPACPTVVCPAPPNVAGHWETARSEQGCESILSGDDGRALGFALLGSAASRWQKAVAEVPNWLS